MARNGKGFLTELAQREARNVDFNFLKPTHSMFGFFTALTDAYSRALMPPAEVSEGLRRDAVDRWAAARATSASRALFWGSIAAVTPRSCS